MTPSNLPVTQQFDAHELESKGIRRFFKIEFPTPDNATMYISPYNQIEWLGQTWETIGCNLNEKSQNSSGEMSRPKFTVANPDGIFSKWIQAGEVEGAILTRYEVLLSDIEAGVNAYSKAMWVISKVVSLNHTMATFELRSTLDGANFSLPARSFYPPDFPTVSLR